MLTFDGCGNRTSMNGGGTYLANNLNQYATFNGAAVTSDATGNLQTWNGVSYAYDAQNRLTNVGAATNFVYDPKNRVVVRSVDGTITFNVWDDWELVEEYAPGNVIAAKYLQGAHGPIKSLLNNVYFYQDSLGSTSHIASSSGALLEYYKYDLYGKPTYWAANGTQLTNGSNNGVRDLFSGERWISEISMYDLRNRFMSPDLGRFLQPDPIGFKGDASNLYRYCGNDWANRTDPMGLYERDVHYDLTEFLAEQAGFSERAAKQIAHEDQRVDESWRTEPIFSERRRREYHFTTSERREQMKSRAYKERSRKEFGKYLHAHQDSYSHQKGQKDGNGEKYGTEWGHLKDGHRPDKAYVRPELAEQMAESTYRELRAFKEHLSGKSQRDVWDAIREQVREMIKSKEGTGTPAPQFDRPTVNPGQ